MRTAKFLRDFKVEELWNKGCSRELIDKFVDVIGFEGTVTEKNIKSIFYTFENENVEELVQYGFLAEKKEEVEMSDCEFIKSILPTFENLNDVSDWSGCEDCKCEAHSDDISEEIPDILSGVKEKIIEHMENVMKDILKEGFGADDDEIIDVKIDINDSFETLVSFKHVDKTIKQITDLMGVSKING